MSHPSLASSQVLPEGYETNGFLGHLTSEQETAAAKLVVMVRDTFKSTESLFQMAHKQISSKRFNTQSDEGKKNLYEAWVLECGMACMSFPPETFLLRFLRARKFDVEKAYSMLMSSLNFRVEQDIMNLLYLGDTVFALEQFAASCIHKTDKLGFPAIFVNASQHVKGAFSESMNRQFTLYSIESARLFLKYPVEKVSIVFDLRNLGLKNLDLDIVRFMIDTLQSFYPECLGRIYIVDAPFIFKGAWAIIKPLLDSVVAAKIKFVSISSLKEHIDDESLLQNYGGSSNLMASYTSPTTNEISEFQKNFESNQVEAKKKIRDVYLEVLNENSKSAMEFLQNGKRVEPNTKSLAKVWKEVDPVLRFPTWHQRQKIVDLEGNVNWK